MKKIKKLKILLLVLVLLAFPGLAANAACGFHNISGYVWSGNTGWISLNCVSGGSVDYGLDIDFLSGNPTEPVTGYAWSPNLGWLDFQPNGPYPASPFNSALFVRDPGGTPTTTAGRITGWAKFLSYGNDGWVLLGPIDNLDENDYGVSITADRVFQGWAWSGGSNTDIDSEPEVGDGWLDWDSLASGGGASILGYWFETLYGNIYSGGNISSSDGLFAPPSGRYNATYLIQADGSIDPVSINSQSGNAAPFKEANISKSFEIPDSENNYIGSLGPLDKPGILNGYYGEVESFPGNNKKTSNTIGSNLVLENKVYYYSGDLQVDNQLTFNKGAGTQKGNGTIVVEGDLDINANILYQSGPVNDRIENLPSVAWIVMGDINIDESVTDIAGVFYSEGDNGLSTGTTGDSETDVTIIIRGMIIASDINLDRLTINTNNDPAEQIIFDGRALVNTPPGLIDIARGLPTLSEISP